MTRTPSCTVWTVADTHWVVVRETHCGWVVEENLGGHFEPLTVPSPDRGEAELLAAAYTATRTNSANGASS